MNRLRITALLLLILTTAAQAEKAHVHGTGSLNIVIEKDQFSLSLELPLDAAVGFERPARTTVEKAALDDTARILNNAATLFTPTPAAQCTVQTVRVEMPFRTPPKPGVTEGHADIDASVLFRCAKPSALRGFETTLFTHFKRLYRIEVQRIGPTGQAAGRLTPKQPALSW
jgi:hypothetical protein